MNQAYIIKKPLITEKSIKDATNGVYTFEVAKTASKDQIAQAVKDFYDVDVTGVRTITIPPRIYRAGRRRTRRIAAAGKKALVQLKQGQKLDLFDTESTD